MENKPFALITCGGTFNSVPGVDGALRPADDPQDFLKYVPELNEMGTIEVIQFENIDSSQADPIVWTKLAIFLNDRKAKYAAIVITHGTDTMPESASALSFIFGRTLEVPVILTGSQLPMRNVQTDARNNLIGAIKVAHKAVREGITEVMIYFNNRVFRGNRVWKQSEVDFDTFTSGNFPLLAYINASPVWQMESQQWDTPVFQPFAIRNKDIVPSPFRPQFSEGVVVTDLYPGTPPEFWLDGIRGGSCKGLILKTMGAGNIPFENPRYDMRPVIREANHAAQVPPAV